MPTGARRDAFGRFGEAAWARAVSSGPEGANVGKCSVFEQYNTIQNHTEQYNTIQSLQNNTVRWDSRRYDTTRYDTKRRNTIQYNTIQYNTMQYDIIQHNVAKYTTRQTCGGRGAPSSPHAHICVVYCIALYRVWDSTLLLQLDWEFLQLALN